MNADGTLTGSPSNPDATGAINSIGLLAAGGVTWIMLRVKQEKAQPELFKKKTPKKAKKA